MAQDEIILKLKVEDGELRGATAAIDKQSKAIDKNTKRKKQGTKASNQNNKAEKALYQTNLSASKGFSKMNQTMGGSSGLVAAYATLAANVFAATAAFGALSRAAQFENLKKGLVQLGAQSGKTLGLVANRLREVTGNAISAEEAMRGAALGISGGFGGAELEGLAKIAKGASVTLGRSLPDAFDRLTRGAIKLEPEILDELGIMVRVDEAAQRYATTLGKTVGSLTQMEKRQAFMNEILIQGEAKFGDIADAIDTDPYAKLGATFQDLTKDIFSFLNETLALNTVVEYLAGNVMVLFGVMLMFGSTIAGKMLPALGDAGGRALAAADGMKELASSSKEFAEKAVESRTAAIGLTGGGSAAFQDMAKNIRKNGADTNKLEKAYGKLSQSWAGLTRQGVKMETFESATHKAKMHRVRTEMRNVQALITQKKIQQKIEEQALVLEVKAQAAQQAGVAIQAFSVGAASFGQASLTIADGYSVLRDNLDDLAIAAGDVDIDGNINVATKSLNRMKAGWATATAQVRLFGAAVLKALPHLAAIVVVAGVFWGFWKRATDTEQNRKFQKTIEDIDKIWSELPEKAKAYEKAVNDSRNIADSQIKSWKIVSGIITETTDAMLAMQKAEIEANKQGFFSAGRKGDDPAIKKSGQVLNKLRTSLLKDGQDTFGLHFQNMENIRGIIEITDKTVAGSIALLGNSTSKEVEALNDMLGHDIPELNEALGRSLNKVLEEVTTETTEAELQQLIRNAWVMAEKEVGNIGPALEGVRSSMQEAERETTNFLKTFGQSTGVDKLVESVSAIDNAFIDLEKSSGAMGAVDQGMMLAKTFMDIGPSLAKIMGADFMQAQAELRAQNDILVEMKKAGKENTDEYTDQKEKVDQLTLAIHDYKGTYEDVSQSIKDIQKIERERVFLNKQISKIASGLQKIMQKSQAAAGLAHKTAIAGFKVDQTLLRNKKELLGFEDALLVKNKTSADTRIKILDLVNAEGMTQERLKKILEDNGKTVEDMENYLNINFQLQQKTLEISKAQELQQHINAEQMNTALETEIKLRKKLADQASKIEEVELRMLNFRNRGTTELDPAQAAKQKVEAAKREFEFAKKKAETEKAILNARNEIAKIEMKFLNAQIDLTNAKLKDEDKIEKLPIEKISEQLDDNLTLSEKAIDNNVELLRKTFALTIAQGFEAIRDAVAEGKLTAGEGLKGLNELAGDKNAVDAMFGGTPGTRAADYREEAKLLRASFADDQFASRGLLDEATDDRMLLATRLDDKADRVDKEVAGGDGARRKKLEDLKTAAGGFIADMNAIGPEGEAFGNILSGALGIADALQLIGTAGEDSASRLKGVMGVMNGIAGIMSNVSKSRVMEIDKEIKAEEQRDGKSKQSLAKIKALKQRKYEMEKKAFEQNKKMQIANALISTYSAVAEALPDYVLAAASLAMGMMQVAAIQKTSFQGAAPGGDSLSPPASIEVGKRTNKVDVSQTASAGELAYLRGNRGIGTNANNFQAMGGAAGLRKGYASGGVLVGEQGPEIIKPLSPMEVVPNDRIGSSKPIEAHITINAIDAQGVEDVLMSQQGNIISMIRSAANDYGEEFLETVNTDVYGTPKSGGGIDY